MMNDPDENVIDFSKAKLNKNKRAKSIKKMIAIAASILAAVLMIACLVVFVQIREVVSEKDFWDNFQTTQS